LNEKQLRTVHGVWDYPLTFVMFQHVSGHTGHYATHWSTKGWHLWLYI